MRGITAKLFRRSGKSATDVGEGTLMDLRDAPSPMQKMSAIHQDVGAQGLGVNAAGYLAPEVRKRISTVYEDSAIPYEILQNILACLAAFVDFTGPFPDYVHDPRHRNALIAAALVNTRWSSIAVPHLLQGDEMGAFVLFPHSSGHRSGTPAHFPKIAHLRCSVDVWPDASTPEDALLTISGAYPNVRCLAIELKFLEAYSGEGPEEGRRISRALRRAMGHMRKLQYLSVSVICPSTHNWFLRSSWRCLDELVHPHFAGHLRIPSQLFGNRFIGLKSLVSYGIGSIQNLSELFTKGNFSQLRSLCIRHVKHSAVPARLIAQHCPDLRELWYGDLCASRNVDEQDNAAWYDELDDISRLRNLERLACAFRPSQHAPILHLPSSLMHFHVLDINDLTARHLLRADLRLKTLVIYNDSLLKASGEYHVPPLLRTTALLEVCNEADIRLWLGSAVESFPWARTHQVAQKQLFNAAYNRFKHDLVSVQDGQESGS